MPPLPAQRFIVSLAFCQDHVRPVQRLPGILGQCLIHSARDGRPVGHKLGHLVHPHVEGVFARGVVQRLLAPDHHREGERRKPLFQLFQKQLVQHDFSAVVTDEKEATGFAALAEKGRQHFLILPAELCIPEQLEEVLLIHPIQGAEVDVVTDSGVSQRLFQRVRRLFELRPDGVLHGQNQIVVLPLALSEGGALSETPLVCLLKEIEQIRRRIAVAPALDDLTDLRKICGIAAHMLLFFIQARSAALRQRHPLSSPFFCWNVCYSMVRIPVNPVTSKISMMTSLTWTIFMLPCLFITFCAERSTRRPAEEM